MNGSLIEENGLATTSVKTAAKKKLYVATTKGDASSVASLPKMFCVEYANAAPIQNSRPTTDTPSSDSLPPVAASTQPSTLKASAISLFLPIFS